MALLKRVVAAIIASILLASTVYLGLLSGTDGHFIVWFGISSAIGAPAGLMLLGYAFRRRGDELVRRLAKVPEIENLMEQARTEEEKVRLLEVERNRLAEIVRLESRRQAIADRLESLEGDATRILAELEALDREMAALDQRVSGSSVSEEIGRLRKRVEARLRGDIIVSFGSRWYRIDRDVVRALPLGMGSLLLIYYRLLESLTRTDSRRTG